MADEMPVKVVVTDADGTVLDSFDTMIDVVPDRPGPQIARAAVTAVAEDIRFGVA